MQQPTCTNVRIRSTQDAHRIFFAIQKGLLHMVTRRLDANERLALTTGCVYAWEERGPHSELTGLGIERFTEGRRWSPSRVRDEFLFYYEKYTTHQDPHHPGAIQETHPPRNWDPLVKQTYSVWVETDKGRRKWHLTAYFTQTTVDDLGTIDDIPGVRDLAAPLGIFTSTRVNKSRGKSDEQTTQPSEQQIRSTTNSRTYAPFPSLNAPRPSQSVSPPASESVMMYTPYTSVTYNQYPSHTVTPIPAQVPSQYSHNVQRHIAPSAPTQNLHLTHSTSRSGTMGPNTCVTLPPTASSPHLTFPTLVEYPVSTHLLRTPSPKWNESTIVPTYQDCAADSHISQGILPPYSRLNIGPCSLPPVKDPSTEDRPRSTTTSSTSVPRIGSLATVLRDDVLHGPLLLAMHEPSYELSSQDVNDAAGRKGSIGPDRDLAPIHALTRRHPYRRDPLDDKTLRLLPR